MSEDKTSAQIILDSIPGDIATLVDECYERIVVTYRVNIPTQALPVYGQRIFVVEPTEHSKLEVATRCSKYEEVTRAELARIPGVSAIGNTVSFVPQVVPPPAAPAPAPAPKAEAPAAPAKPKRGGKAAASTLPPTPPPAIAPKETAPTPPPAPEVVAAPAPAEPESSPEPVDPDGEPSGPAEPGEDFGADPRDIPIVFGKHLGKCLGDMLAMGDTGIQALRWYSAANGLAASVAKSAGRSPNAEEEAMISGSKAILKGREEGIYQ